MSKKDKALDYFKQKEKTPQIIVTQLTLLDRKIIKMTKQFMEKGIPVDEYETYFNDLVSKEMTNIEKTLAAAKAKELAAGGYRDYTTGTVQSIYTKVREKFAENLTAVKENQFPKWRKIPHVPDAIQAYAWGMRDILIGETKPGSGELIYTKANETRDINTLLRDFQQRRIAYTILNTELQRLNRQIEKEVIAEETGFSLAYYYGGIMATTRNFCLDNIGKAKTWDEWEKMDNGQGLPVTEYCGGWNCHHNLVACDKSMARDASKVIKERFNDPAAIRSELKETAKRAAKNRITLDDDGLIDIESARQIIQEMRK